MIKEQECLEPLSFPFSGGLNARKDNHFFLFFLMLLIAVSVIFSSVMEADLKKDA